MARKLRPSAGKSRLELFGPDGKRESSALGISLALPPELF